jgi:tRNA threonylcarbamoyladenosine biosynthesis protein TsaB
MILALDTSGKSLGLALCGGDRTIVSRLSHPGLKHGEILQNEISDFLNEANAGFKNLTAIAVTLGPGSYTGLRIGLAAAKGYAYSMRLPLVGISTLKASAGQFSQISRKVLTIIDARRNELYFAQFDCNGDYPLNIIPDSIGQVEDVRKLIDDDTIVVCPSQIKEQIVAEKTFSDYHISDNLNLAEPAGLWARRMLQSGEILDAATATPVYLRSGF